MRIKNNKILLIENKEQQANYYVKEQKVIDYGETFFHELTQCSLESKNVSDRILPIMCYYDMEDIINAVQTGKRGASFAHLWTYGDRQAIIKVGINGDSDKLTATLKRNIKHEIIHYFLYLIDIPCDDNSLPFWCICHLYNAGAYEKLNGLYDDLYQFFIRKCEEIDIKINDDFSDSIKLSLAINLYNVSLNNKNYNSIIEITSYELNKNIDNFKKIDSILNGITPNLQK